MITFLLGALSAGLMLGYPLWRMACHLDGETKRVRQAYRWLATADRRNRVLRDEISRQARLALVTADSIRELQDELAWARVTIAVQCAPTTSDRMALLGNVVPMRKAGER